VAGPPLPISVEAAPLPDPLKTAALAWSDPSPEVRLQPLTDGYYHMTNDPAWDRGWDMLREDPLTQWGYVSWKYAWGVSPDGARFPVVDHGADAR